MNRKPLGLTLGDPSGIGPELTVKAWQSLRHSGLAFVALGDRNILAQSLIALSLPEPWLVKDNIDKATEVFSDCLPVIDVPCSTPVQPGKPSSDNAQSIIESIRHGVSLCLTGQLNGLVTNPISKSMLYEGGFQFPGHTEFLAVLCSNKSSEDPIQSVMMLMNDQLKAVPVTIHMSLRDAIAALDTNLIIKTGRIVHTALQSDFGIENPRLAFTGLNPHAGEDGHLGQEDIQIITPALDVLRQDGIHVSGPHPADTLFHEEARETYDVAICMYHDQALIPVKTLDFHSGVNVTLGLPIIRTSPDHGTAFDIAGQGVARPDSLIAALHQADLMATNRLPRS